MSRSLSETTRSGSLSSLLVSCALLLAALLLIAPAFAWYGYSQAHWTGVLASAIAAALCGLGATLALVTAYVANRMGNGVQGVLAGMFFRMGIPLVGGLILDQQVKWLADAGVFGQVLGFYLFVLVIETLLSLRFVAPSGAPAAKAS